MSKPPHGWQTRTSGERENAIHQSLSTLPLTVHPAVIVCSSGDTRSSAAPMRVFAMPCLMHALTAARLLAPPAAPQQSAARLHAASVASAARRAGRAAADVPSAAAQRGPVSAVRPVPIKLITVSKGGSAALEEAAAEYLTRLRRYTALEEIRVKPNPRGAAADDAAAQMAAEAERVVRAVGPRDRLVRRPTRAGRRLCSLSPAGAALRARQGRQQHGRGAAAQRRRRGESQRSRVRYRRSVRPRRSGARARRRLHTPLSPGAESPGGASRAR